MGGRGKRQLNIQKITANNKKNLFDTHLNDLGPESSFSPFLMPLREHHYGGGGSCSD